MRTKMIWANLTSADLDKTRKFYSDLGFKINGDYNNDELASFSFGENNFVINFFTLSRMAKNGIDSNAAKGSEILFSLSAESREEVDQWVEKVKSAGGKILFKAQNIEKGYTLNFSDPDGHKFNVLYWPGM